MAGFQFPIAEIRLFYQKLSLKGLLTEVDSFLRLCSIFENKTDVGPSDNVVQLIKAHSLHTSFAVFEKKLKFNKNYRNFYKQMTHFTGIFWQIFVKISIIFIKF